jgi:hypothetical protein
MGADEEKRIKLNSSLVSRPIIRFSPPSAVQTPILPSSLKNAQNVMKKFLHKKKVKKGTIELPISTTVSNVY